MTESRFGALRDLRRDPPPAVIGPVKPPAKAKPATPKSASVPSRTAGKSSNKDEFERLTIYLRKDTKKAAGRKWQDATGKDMSDLIEKLLTDYLST